MSTDLADLPLFRGAADGRPVDPYPVSSAPARPTTSSRSSATAEASELDWSQVVSLRKEASTRITAEVERREQESGRPLGGTDRRLLGRSIIRRVVGDQVRTLYRDGAALWSTELEQSYVTAVDDAVFGYGRLQPLLSLPEVENIEIHGCDSVVVQYGDGRREARPPVAESDDELVEAIRFLGENAQPGRPFDDLHPTMTVALGERFRLHAIGFGLSYRPSVVIRQHVLTTVSLADLAGTGMLPVELAELLDAAVLARMSIVVSGDQGAGKTTLLRALIAAIPGNERFATLETDYELMTHRQPGRRNMLALQARQGHGERSADGAVLGSVTVADLIPEALRQNLSRLVVGEVRGSEAGAMFEAMQAGAGTMSTTHSHSAASTMDRLAARVAQGGVVSIDEAYRQIAHNVGLFVHVALVDDTWRGGTRRRYVSEVRRVTGAIENDRPVTHLVYRAGTDDADAVFHPDGELSLRLAPYRRPLQPADSGDDR